MCELCNGTKWFSGRVDHTRWRNLEGSSSSRTDGGKIECWQEGNVLWCPHCVPDAYGKVTKITAHSPAASRSPESGCKTE